MDAATIYRRRWGTLAVLCVSLLVIGLDTTILNVALPTLVEDLHATASQQQWMVDAYVLVFASLLLTAGALGDKFGRRGALTVGLALFGVGSAAAAFSGSAGALIGARGFMGIGGALIMPATLSILTNVFTDPAERAKAIGIWAGVSGLGVAIGPVTGGWLLEHFWWGSVFLINLPVVALGLVAGRVLIPTSRDPESPRLDLVGTAMSAVGLFALLYGIIEGPSKGWSNSSVVGAFAIGIVVLVSFVVWELRSSHPILDVRFFANPRFSGASVAITLVFFSLFGSIFFLTQYLQFVMDYGTLQAGLAIAPVALALMVAAPIAPILAKRFGTKAIVAAGLLVVAAALVLLSTATVTSGYGIVLAVIVTLGVGMGLAMAPATESIMGSLPKAKAGVGSAVNDTTREVGGALGVAILGSLLAAAYHSSMDTSAAVQALPAPAAAAAHDSLGGAVQVAGQLGAAGQPLLADATRAFVDAMSSTVLIGAVVAALGALVALVWLPSRAPAIEVDESELERITDDELAMAAD
jgi:EmrB/QacA subfamily drug resistance transporter